MTVGHLGKTHPIKNHRANLAKEAGLHLMTAGPQEADTKAKVKTREDQVVIAATVTVPMAIDQVVTELAAAGQMGLKDK